MIVARVLASVVLLSLALVFVGATAASAATPPTTTVIIPSTGAKLQARSVVLDATASGASAADPVKSVQFLITAVGGTGYSTTCSATPTLYGWICILDTNSFSINGVNGPYTVQSEALDSVGVWGYSAPVNVTINAIPPPTAVIIPSTGANLQARNVVLDATASGASAADPVSVQFLITSTSGTYYSTTCPAAPTIYGWICILDTNSFSINGVNGPYTVQSEALDSVGVWGYSAPVNVTINAIPPTATIIIPSTGAVLSGPTNVFDALGSSASGGPVAVKFALTPVGGTSDYCAGSCYATRTIYGYIYIFPTAAAINGGLTPGSYTLSTLVEDQVGVYGYGPPVTITLAKSAP